jgi:two-component system response regulator
MARSFPIALACACVIPPLKSPIENGLQQEMLGFFENSSASGQATFTKVSGVLANAAHTAAFQFSVFATVEGTNITGSNSRKDKMSFKILVTGLQANLILPSPQRDSVTAPLFSLPCRGNQPNLLNHPPIPMAAIRILLIEDNPGDVDLTREALAISKLHNSLDVVNDGEAAMTFLLRQGKYADAMRPDLVLLDLNLPKKDGREVLLEIKSNDTLKSIPVVILTTSKDEEDISSTYKLHANCFITKPIDLTQFIQLVQTIEEFWFVIVKLPSLGTRP